MKTLPIGKSSFESIRTGGELYVDKTRHIFKLIDSGDYYFLSRPRRFGKSLTISTLRCLFEGKQELFDGLWISKHGQWAWDAHPVVLIDFNGISHDTPEQLQEGLDSRLVQIGLEHGIELEESLMVERFMELILALRRTTGRTVVILVDEYDKPLIDHLGKGENAMEIAKANRDILKYFFGVIKGIDVAPALRFVFFTGVSKFSQASIFSGLNNLTDITMNRHYSEMLGYTQEELETCFEAHIREFAAECGLTPEAVIEGLRDHYNGYRFSEKDVRVYNPFSVLSALAEQAFKHYWFETGTPTFLVNLIRNSNWQPPQIENMRATETMFSTYDLDDLKPEALLFQTGYVTIKDVRGRLFTFDYPNREVKTAFLETLFLSYAKGMADRSRFVLLAEYLLAEDVDAFIETVSAIFASIPYTLETKRDEAYFHTLFYLMVSASGADARTEVLGYRGRIDLVLGFSDKVYIIEFKCDGSAKAALKQIHDKGYADPYRQSGKKLILMGINFDSEARNVAEWEIEDGR